MLHIKFQTSEHCGSEEEDFEKKIYVLKYFKPKPSWCEAILDPGTFVWTNLAKDN